MAIRYSDRRVPKAFVSSEAAFIDRFSVAEGTVPGSEFVNGVSGEGWQAKCCIPQKIFDRPDGKGMEIFFKSHKLDHSLFAGHKVEYEEVGMEEFQNIDLSPVPVFDKDEPWGYLPIAYVRVKSLGNRNVPLVVFARKRIVAYLNLFYGKDNSVVTKGEVAKGFVASSVNSKLIAQRVADTFSRFMGLPVLSGKEALLVRGDEGSIPLAFRDGKVYAWVGGGGICFDRDMSPYRRASEFLQAYAYAAASVMRGDVISAVDTAFDMRNETVLTRAGFGFLTDISDDEFEKEGGDWLRSMDLPVFLLVLGGDITSRDLVFRGEKKTQDKKM